MNDTFDIKRFSLLVKKDLAENWKKYMLGILLMLGVTCILFVWISVNYYEDYTGSNHMLYDFLSERLFAAGIILFLVYACLSASWVMDPIRDKTRRISYLSNPTSSFEKYIIRWGIQVVLFLVVYITILFVADFVQWLVCTVRYPELNVHSINWSGLIPIDKEVSYPIFREWKEFFLSLSICFFIQSLFVLGATFWQKNSLIKTFCAGFVIFLLYITVCGLLIFTLFDEGIRGFANAFEDIIVRDNEDRFIYMVIGGLVFFTVANWILGYFRFKETEIVKRI